MTSIPRASLAGGFDPSLLLPLSTAATPEARPESHPVPQQEPRKIPRSLRGIDTALRIDAVLPLPPEDSAPAGDADGLDNAFLSAAEDDPLGEHPPNFSWAPGAAWFTIADRDWQGFTNPAAPPLAQIDLEPLTPRARTNSDLRVGFERDTTFINGGFSAPTAPGERGPAYFGSSGERFERFNLDLEWTPLGGNAPVQWLVLSGVQAVRADLGRLGDANLGISGGRGTVAIPTIGTGIRWQPSDAMTFSTTAATQTVDQNGGVVDFSLNAEFRLSRGVGLTAGYEFFQSDVVVDDLRTSLDREGVFAKLTIRF